jgi:uncharacterized protein
MIIRTLEEKIREKIDFKKAIFILGPRQVGKTTMAKNIAKSISKDYLYLNADEPETRNLWREDNITFLQQSFGKARLILLDEARLIPNIGLICKR